MYWAEQYSHLGQLIRYADDFVIICRTKREAEQALQAVKQIMTKLKLTLHPTKTRVVDMGREGFDFLGFHFHKLKAKKSNKLLPYMWPGQKAMKAVRTKIHQITERKRLSNPLTEVVKYLNLVIRGWRNYFKSGNSTEKFQDLDRYVWQRLQKWLKSQGVKSAGRKGVLESLLAQNGLEYFYPKGRCGARP